MQTVMPISHLAKALGVSPSAVRYWEQNGLVVAPTRESGTGRRLYTESDLARMQDWRAGIAKRKETPRRSA